MIVPYYYHALYSGDLSSVKRLMTHHSYVMTLESFGLRLAFKNPQFKEMLSRLEEDNKTFDKVERLLSADLQARRKNPEISDIRIIDNGKSRRRVAYLEDGKEKKLYLSLNNSQWLIDYYAGCPID